MGFPVILTPQSQHDLGSIVRYIRTESPERAKAFGYGLIEEASAIGRFPEIGRVVRFRLRGARTSTKRQRAGN